MDRSKFLPLLLTAVLLLLLSGCGSRKNASHQEVSRMPLPGRNPSYNAYIHQYAPAALQSE